MVILVLKVNKVILVQRVFRVIPDLKVCVVKLGSKDYKVSLDTLDKRVFRAIPVMKVNVVQLD